MCQTYVNRLGRKQNCLDEKTKKHSYDLSPIV